MYVIGTAGHVDHGKSTLVKKLTGIDPDRWAEEQRREMTIDLGFAWLTLPSQRHVSIIDVPGHERFIKNMLAGVGGIDAAMLVVAADESVMPQTEEHLAILDLLGVEHGLVVVTRTDLVDAEWLALVEDELAQWLHGTTLAHAPRVAVSARTGQGIDTLLHTLDQVLDHLPARATTTGVPRLPIDRSFQIGGFGTVVTGTLLGGTLAVGQEVVVLPAGLRGRIRGLQTHNRHVEQVLPGMRVAVNLAGIHHAQVVRGDMLTLPDKLAPTSLLDAHLRLLATAPRPLEHNTQLDLFIGAAELSCRVALLDQDVLAPGQSGWVQLRLECPGVTVPGTRFIVRQPSPSLTIGGGVIVDTHPLRHRRFRADVLAALETRARGVPEEVLLQCLGTDLPRRRADLLAESRLDEVTARAGLDILVSTGQAMQLDQDIFISSVAWQKLEVRLVDMLRTYHERFPLRRGILREEIRRRLGLEPVLLQAVLITAASRGVLSLNETSVWLADFTPQPAPEQQRVLQQFLHTLQQSPYTALPATIDAELLAWSLEQGLLVRANDIYLLPQTYAEMLEWVQATIHTQGSVSVASMRDHFGSSRKYALSFLEHLDERKITRRHGDIRVLY